MPCLALKRCDQQAEWQLFEVWARSARHVGTAWAQGGHGAGQRPEKQKGQWAL